MTTSFPHFLPEPDLQSHQRLMTRPSEPRKGSRTARPTPATHLEAVWRRVERPADHGEGVPFAGRYQQDERVVPDADDRHRIARLDEDGSAGADAACSAWPSGPRPCRCSPRSARRTDTAQRDLPPMSRACASIATRSPAEPSTSPRHEHRDAIGVVLLQVTVGLDIRVGGRPPSALSRIVLIARMPLRCSALLKPARIQKTQKRVDEDALSYPPGLDHSGEWDALKRTGAPQYVQTVFRSSSSMSPTAAHETPACAGYSDGPVLREQPGR